MFLGAASTGCSSSTGDQPRSGTTRSHSVSAGATETTAPTAASSASPSTSLPQGAGRIARAFTAAYAQHDARDGGDRSYADAGARAAEFASGELADVLAQKRPSQDKAWAALRAEQARQKVKVTSAVVPDGAPAVSASSALVRVGYTLTTAPRSGPPQHSSEQLVVRLERTSEGWRVAALPWA